MQSPLRMRRGVKLIIEYLCLAGTALREKYDIENQNRFSLTVKIGRQRDSCYLN
jgi:hypothetical protein